MQEPRGRYLSIPGPRRFIGDLVHFAHRIPSAPVSLSIDLSQIAAIRTHHFARPSWACIFMKAYALVGAANPPLRRSLLEFPWARLYEHPYMHCALAIERTYRGEEGGLYRMTLRFSHVPKPIRRFLWWATLNISGTKRGKRFGTFGLSSYGSLGAEQIHPISPLTTTLTYGPIDPITGRVTIKLIYDHRVLDGAYVARRLHDIQETLNGPIRAELQAGQTPPNSPARALAPPPIVEPLLRPHLLSPTREPDRASSPSEHA
jgi:hypothetical protein